MKKTIVLLLGLVISIFALGGCGDQPKDQGATEVSNTVQKTTQFSEGSNNEQQDESAQLASFNFATQEFVSFFDNALTGQGFSTIVTDNPDVEEKTIDKYGNINCYTYYWATGGFLLIYSTKESDSVVKIVLAADIDILDSNALNEYSFCLGLLIGMIDENMRPDIKSALNLNNITEESITTAIGENGNYTYSVSQNSVILIITPVSK